MKIQRMMGIVALCLISGMIVDSFATQSTDPPERSKDPDPSGRKQRQTKESQQQPKASARNPQRWDRDDYQDQGSPPGYSYWFQAQGSPKVGPQPGYAGSHPPYRAPPYWQQGQPYPTVPPPPYTRQALPYGVGPGRGRPYQEIAELFSCRKRFEHIVPTVKALHRQLRIYAGYHEWRNHPFFNIVAAVVNAFHLLPPPIRYYTTRYPNGRTSTPSEAEDSYPLADGEDQGNMASDAPETRRSSRAGGTDASAFPNGAEGRGPRYPSRVIGVKTRGVLPPPGRSELAYWRIGYQALVHLVADLQLAMDSYGAYPDCREHPLFTTAAALVRAFYSSPPPFNLELPQWFQDGMTIWSSDEEDQGQMTSGSPELRSSRTGVSDEIASNMDDPLHRADEHADGTIPEEGESKRPPAEEESRGDLRPEPLIDAK